MIAPWMLLMTGVLLVWLGLKNKATDLINAVFASASPFTATRGQSAASNGDNKGAPAATGQGPAVG